MQPYANQIDVYSASDCTSLQPADTVAVPLTVVKAGTATQLPTTSADAYPNLCGPHILNAGTLYTLASYHNTQAQIAAYQGEQLEWSVPLPVTDARLISLSFGNASLYALLGNSSEAWVVQIAPQSGIAEISLTLPFGVPSTMKATADGLQLFFVGENGIDGFEFVPYGGAPQAPIVINGAFPLFGFDTGASGNFALGHPGDSPSCNVSATGPLERYDAEGRSLGAVNLSRWGNCPQLLSAIPLSGGRFLIQVQNELADWVAVIDKDGSIAWEQSMIATRLATDDAGRILSLGVVGQDHHIRLSILSPKDGSLMAAYDWPINNSKGEAWTTMAIVSESGWVYTLMGDQGGDNVATVFAFDVEKLPAFG